MRPYTLEEICEATGGRIVSGSSLTQVTGVSIDSRKVKHGDLFCAIVGERVDGHSFIKDVIEKGACAALIEHEIELDEETRQKTFEAGFGLIMVESTTRALGKLAARYRREIPLDVIGITGSVGKTSTKDLVHSVLSQKFRTYKNPGNLNSHIGLPLAVLGITPGCQFAVLEMGMRARGEINELCGIAKPKIGVLTDISASHIGILGSLDEIALAKAELLDSLPQDGLAVLCGDNPWVIKVSKHAKCKVLFYGFREGVDYRAVDARTLGETATEFLVKHKGKSYQFSLNMPGRHQVENALAAVTVGFELGLSYDQIRAGLSNISLSPMRQEIIHSGSLTIINDAYNASFKSMKAALDLLSQIGKNRKIAILGDMLELGDFGPEEHRKVGKYARSKADYLIAIGKLAAHIKEAWDEFETFPKEQSSWFSDKAKARKFIKDFVKPGDTCLVKASRGMEFESLVEFLKNLGIGKVGAEGC